MSRLEVRGVSKTYRGSNGQVVEALAEVSLTAAPRQFISLVGPSGCGKSTLFNLIVGLDEPDSGDICLADQPLRQRLGRFGYMPQRDLLLPWRTILANVTLGPELAGENMRAAQQEALELMPLFGLEGFEKAYPDTLSGGMRQRAALLRTFLSHREIMLFDEPFGALDALTRRELQSWLLGVWRRFEKTILFVTHDVEEALYLSDRVLVMSPRPGRIVLDLTVMLPRPRREEMLVSPEIIEYKAELMAALAQIPPESL